jgi:hypothetical protein
MVKAIAQAFRWRKMPENGTHATITEIAAAEKINERSALADPARFESFRCRFPEASNREAF